MTNIHYLSFLLLPFFSLVPFIVFPFTLFNMTMSNILDYEGNIFQSLFLPFIGIPFISYFLNQQNFLLLSAIGISFYTVIPIFIEIFKTYYQSNYFDKRGFVVYLLTTIQYIVLYLVNDNPYYIMLSYMIYYTITYIYVMFNTNSPTLPLRQMDITTFYMVVVMLIYFYNIYIT